MLRRRRSGRTSCDRKKIETARVDFMLLSRELNLLFGHSKSAIRMLKIKEELRIRVAIELNLSL